MRLIPDDPIWQPTTFTQNRNCLHNEQAIGSLLEILKAAAAVKWLFSDEHFSVDVTLLRGLGFPCLSGLERRKTVNSIAFP